MSKAVFDYPKAIDVNANIPLQDISGYKFCFIKYTEGVGYTSPGAAKWVTQCRTDKVPFGLYHYARPDTGNNVSNEVDWYLSQLKKYPDCKAMALDWEDKSLTVKDGELWAYNFLQEIYRKTLKKPLIYMSASEAKKSKYTMIAEYFPLWLAQWGPEPQMQAWDTWLDWSLWQYTNKPFDHNYISKSFENDFMDTVSHETFWKISEQSKNKVTVQRDDGIIVTVSC